jgi:hypothetical protein
LFAEYGVTFDFTCLEMMDSDPSCKSEPEELVKQTILASQSAGIRYSGENALQICNPICDEDAFNEVYKESTQYGNINRFTYLRLDDDLLTYGNNKQIFSTFIQKMNNA